MKIYKPFLYYVDLIELKSDLKQGKTHPLIDEYFQIEFYSDEDALIKELSLKIKEFNEDKSLENHKIVYCGYTTHLINKPSEFTITVYDEKLQYLGNFEKNIPIQENYLTPGDWVLFYDSMELQIGRIACSPDHENPYYLVTESMDINDENPHAHITPCKIWKRITDEEAKEFLPPKHYRNISDKCWEIIQSWI